ncbi:MAG TPA: ABC transporter ATP-binding protein [Gaiellales bacterium]|jgi:spermidine/putrescine ABC transporter ATP-binding subunit|nr:ABC transporter ATP-binding protein [Gaiellales bacterium]
MSSATTTSQPGAAAADAGESDVEFRAVTKRFGSLVAVNAVNLRVHKGEFLSLLGPSGCGKTTSLRMIAGFEQPDEGEILIGGSDVAGTPPYKRDVNTVFQQYALFPHMSILDNVCYGLKQRKVGKRERHQRAGEALELVQLTGRDKHRPAMLSGGQQQRVALARALVMNPRVLLLDEPLGALDLKLRKEMQIELKRIQSQVGITFIYVTHDQEEALSMSDRVAVMSNGVIEQLDEPRTIYDRPLTPFVADFIGDMNFIDGDVVEAADGGFAVDAGSGVVIRGRGETQRGKRVRIGIRPERMAAHPGQPDGTANKAAGEVVTKMYLGDQVQVVATLANGTSVVVREQRASADPALDTIHPGDQIAVGWDEAAPHMLGDADTTEEPS